MLHEHKVSHLNPAEVEYFFMKLQNSSFYHSNDSFFNVFTRKYLNSVNPNRKTCFSRAGPTIEFFSCTLQKCYCNQKRKTDYIVMLNVIHICKNSHQTDILLDLFISLELKRVTNLFGKVTNLFGMQRYNFLVTHLRIEDKQLTA